MHWLTFVAVTVIGAGIAGMAATFIYGAWDALFIERANEWLKREEFYNDPDNWTLTDEHIRMMRFNNHDYGLICNGSFPY